VDEGKDNLLEELQRHGVSSRVRSARVVVLWIGKNHIGGERPASDQRALQRAGKSHENNMTLVLKKIDEINQGRADEPLVLVLNLFSPEKAGVVACMNDALRTVTSRARRHTRASHLTTRLPVGRCAPST
jgi:hypothetical protein